MFLKVTPHNQTIATANKADIRLIINSGHHWRPLDNSEGPLWLF